ncbi:MAG: DUF3883 domain-containing protein [Bacilli bacterium]|nr:DUF3883 domain-containing protein [Bacilli bacterium]
MLLHERSEELENYLFLLKQQKGLEISKPLIHSCYDEVKDYFSYADIQMEIRGKLERFLNHLYDDTKPFFFKQHELFKSIDYEWIDYIASYFYAVYLDNEALADNFIYLMSSLIRNFMPHIDFDYDKFEERVSEMFRYRMSEDRITISFPKYNPKYDEILPMLDVMPLNNIDMFYIWSEREVYNSERNINPQNKIIWVAKEEGDGYGYDVLSYNPYSNKENAIEVKASKNSSSTSLTENERYYALKSRYYTNTDYSIYHYFHNPASGEISTTKYCLDKETGLFIGTDGFEYSISGKLNQYNQFNLEKTPESIEKVFKKFKCNQ